MITTAVINRKTAHAAEINNAPFRGIVVFAD